MQITLNGESRSIEDVSLGCLLESAGLSEGVRFVAIAVNGRVVPRGTWDGVKLSAGDRVEIVHPVQGG